MVRLKYSLTKPFISADEGDAVSRVLRSGWLAEGDATLLFERRVAETVEARYAVAVCNCTVALELCLKAYEIKGEVAIPDFTHPATAQAVLNAHCKPVLNDVSLETFNITGADTQTSIPVSWGGNPVTEYPRTFIIEDAACSIGSSYQRIKTGSKFTTCFSFHPRKLVTCGEGAVVTTESITVADRLRELKSFGRGGGNYKLNDIASAIGFIQMDKLEAVIDRRRAMAQIYMELLANVKQVTPPTWIPEARQTFQSYAVLLKDGNRERIIAKLRQKGIETQKGAFALHLLPAYRRLKRRGKLPNSTVLHWHMLCLPMAYDITEEGQKTVVAELKHELAR